MVGKKDKKKEDGNVKSLIKVLLFRKDILPTTFIFIIITIFFTGIKIQLEIQEFKTLVSNRVYVLAFLVTAILYFSLIFIFSFNEKTSKLFYSKGSLGKSFLQMIVWIVVLFFIVRNYPKEILRFFYWILLLGSVVWLAINAFLINNTFMKNVGFEEKVKFSWIKFISGVILFVASFYGSFWLWFREFNIQNFNFWVIFTVIFGIMVLLMPKYALNTAGFYFIVFLYFSFYIYDFMNQNSSTLDSFYFLNKFAINIILLVINYYLLFLTIGKISASVNVEKEGKKGTGRNLFFIFLITVSYLTLEFVFPTVFPDLQNPELVLLLFRFFSIMGTSIIVYFYKTIYKRK